MFFQNDPFKYFDLNKTFFVIGRTGNKYPDRRDRENSVYPTLNLLQCIPHDKSSNISKTNVACETVEANSANPDLASRL